MAFVMINPEKTLNDALDRYEAEHAFARQVILAEEDRKLLRLPFAGQRPGYRWFRSPNIVCLEKYRRLRSAAIGCK